MYMYKVLEQAGRRQLLAMQCNIIIALRWYIVPQAGNIEVIRGYWGLKGAKSTA
jgi:hypothetical protein